MAAEPSPPPMVFPSGPDRILRNSVVFLAVVVAAAIVRFFADLIAPLVVAVFLLLLIDAFTRWLRRVLPGAPDLVRTAVAAFIILASFAAIGALLALEAQPLSAQIRGLEPRVNGLLAQAEVQLGQEPKTLGQLLNGVDPAKAVAGALEAASKPLAFGGLVVIYLGFIVASRTAFTKKINGLYATEAHRQAARRVIGAVRNAVEQYVRLQTLKALMIALSAWFLMFLLGMREAPVIAFIVFLSAYVPILGAFAGSIFPGVIALSHFDDLARPLGLIAVLGSAVFIIDNVIMPKLQSDELNIDPLLVLISIGLWGAIFGTTGVLLSTPLTVTVMAVCAEFDATRWLAVMISRDGNPIHGATEP